jgi:hypothetical protein
MCAKSPAGGASARSGIRSLIGSVVLTPGQGAGTSRDRATRRAYGDLAFSGRSAVYRWLRKNFDEVSRSLAVFRPSWDVVAAQIHREGVIGARGKPPNGRSVRRVWQRVSRDVAKDKAAEATAALKPRPSYPSRVPTTWRPTPVSQPSRQGSPPTDSNGPKSPGDGTGDPRTRSAEEKLAALQRKLDERSGL